MRQASSGAHRQHQQHHTQEMAANNARLSACQSCRLLIGPVPANQHAPCLAVPSRCNQWGRGPPLVCCQARGPSRQLAGWRVKVMLRVYLCQASLPSSSVPTSAFWLVTALSPDCLQMGGAGGRRVLRALVSWKVRMKRQDGGAGRLARAESICHPPFHREPYHPMGERAEESHRQ